MVMWTRDSRNKVLFEERREKYNLFFHPEVSTAFCTFSFIAPIMVITLVNSRVCHTKLKAIKKYCQSFDDTQGTNTYC